MNKDQQQQLSDCGCCEGLKKLTPDTIENQPGLSVIKYRVGTYRRFKSSMFTRLATEKGLSNLTTRSYDDLAISLLDAWATVADVLTFYQERIANEGFLRTAKERRSVLELARSIGYELGPGVAASTFLAFTLEDTPGLVEKTIIEEGTKVQSIPAQQGQTPQIFETIETIEAMPELNELKPKLTLPQIIDEKTTRLYFEGINTQLKPGDGLLVIVKHPHGNGNNIIGVSKFFRIVSQVNTEPALSRTYVEVISIPYASAASSSSMIEPSIILGEPKEEPVTTKKEREGISLTKFRSALDLAKVNVSLLNDILSKRWTVSDYTAFAIKNNLKLPDLFKVVNFRGSKKPSIQAAISMYAFRIKTGLFGHNAPKYDSLPGDLRTKLGDWDKPSPIPINMRALPAQEGQTRREYYGDDGKLIYLDNTYPNILPHSWIVLLTSATRREGESDSKVQDWKAYQVEKTLEETMAEFLLSAKVTGLTLRAQNVNELSNMALRKTTCYAQSEKLILAKKPNEEPIEGNAVTLDRKVNGLRVGQLISVTGETVDINGEGTGLTKSEIAVVSQIEWIDEFSTNLSFVQNLEYRYKRDTVVLNANVAKATHGETKQEILGSGDPSQLEQQQFVLKQKPLTFISAPTETGNQSTIEVRINDVLWKEVRFLYNLKVDDRVYVLRMENNGQTHIIFGDGIRGARPPAGLENIRAKYRVGIGTAGIVEEGKLTMLMSKPLGVRNVTNPIAASGAEDCEKLENARQNATLTTLTMGRIVSLIDFENFAEAFAGIGKAMAIWIWDGEKRKVYLTVASSTGNHIIERNSELYQNLVKAIDRSKDPVTSFQVDSFHQLSFNLAAKILVAEDREPERVLIAVKNALNERFSFASRQFGQSVSLSEVMVTIQQVEGVIAVDIDLLYLSEEEPKLNRWIPSRIARYDKDTILLSQLLILNPAGLTLTVATS